MAIDSPAIPVVPTTTAEASSTPAEEAIVIDTSTASPEAIVVDTSTASLPEAIVIDEADATTEPPASTPKTFAFERAHTLDGSDIPRAVRLPFSFYLLSYSNISLVPFFLAQGPPSFGCHGVYTL